jgi:hypothetical protein
MAVTVDLFASAPQHTWQAQINWTADDIRVALLTSAAAPNLGTWHAYSDLTNEVVAGGGYTTGGVALSGKTNTLTIDSAWATTWTASTSYAAETTVIRPTTANGHLYQCIVTGVSGTTQPTWPTTPGATVADGGATWAEVGRAILQLDATDVSIASSTITARYAVIYDNTPTTGATKWLIGLVNFGADVISSASTFAITWDPLGVVVDFPE